MYKRRHLNWVNLCIKQKELIRITLYITEGKSVSYRTNNKTPRIPRFDGTIISRECIVLEF